MGPPGGHRACRARAVFPPGPAQTMHFAALYGSHPPEKEHVSPASFAWRCTMKAPACCPRRCPRRRGSARKPRLSTPCGSRRNSVPGPSIRSKEMPGDDTGRLRVAPSHRPGSSSTRRRARSPLAAINSRRRSPPWPRRSTMNRPRPVQVSSAIDQVSAWIDEGAPRVEQGAPGNDEGFEDLTEVELGPRRCLIGSTRASTVETRRTIPADET